MTHLMKLELKKVGLKKYVLFSIAGIIISIFFVFVGLNDNSAGKYSYETAFTMVGLMFCFYYITLFSLLVVSYIVNEYSSKTILVMFSYPVDRKKLIMAKLLLIVLLIMASMIIGYVCCGMFIIIADEYLGLISGDFELSILMCWIPTAVKAVITFCTLGIGTFVVGMMKKSVPMTIVSAIILCYIRQFYLAGTDSSEESWLFIIGIVAVMLAGVYYVLAHKVKQID